MLALSAVPIYFLYLGSVLLCYHFILHVCLQLVKLHFCILTLSTTTQPTLSDPVVISANASRGTPTLSPITLGISPHPIALPPIHIVCPYQGYSNIGLQLYLPWTHLVCLYCRDSAVHRLLICLVKLPGHNNALFYSLVYFLIIHIDFIPLILCGWNGKLPQNFLSNYLNHMQGSMKECAGEP